MSIFTVSKKKNINYLELTPYCKCGHSINEKGLVDVLVPRFRGKFLYKLFKKSIKSEFIKANLDEIGSATWLLIDGDSKVFFIGEKLKEQFGDKVDPVYDRLTNFLTQLYRSGIISFKEFN